MSAPSEDPTVAFPATTRRARPRSRSGGTATMPSVSPTGATTGTLSAPIEALERDEIRRTRWFCYVAFVISTVSGSSLGWLHGDPTACAIMLVAIAASALATVFMVYRTRDPVQFRRPSTGLGWVVIAAAATTAIPFFGAFSPAPVVLVLGIYFTSLGKSPRLAFVLYVVAAGVQGLVSVFTIAGLTRDIGLVQAGYLDLRQQLIIQGLVQFVFAMTLVIGRLSRRAQQLAVEELEREVRLSAHREALLIEAREQLERALRPGQGRFTGQQIGAYLLGSVLGRGGMGEVYEADGPGGPVAIKLLSQTSLGNANHVMRFFRELRTAAAIASPNVVKVLEIGEHPVPYLVMERLDGKTLSDILRSRRAMPVADVVDLVYQVGAGITAAAAAGVVHRDLKPQNVFRHGEVWKVLDFGVARAADHGDTLTAGQIVGTPSYMAPEQASAGEVDPLTDLYALAAIAYRALTGHAPHASGDLAETLYRVVHASPRRPSDLSPRLPHDVDLVLAIGLAKRPDDRFCSADELAGALADALTGQLAPVVRDRGLALVRTGGWADPPAAAVRRRLASG
ncbi:MAG TPA: serine/threonine-protein kinase [Kofleriaceae bacterium]|nr:serine/threonine-protein kinase [Kofleriaceae bacterium]